MAIQEKLIEYDCDGVTCEGLLAWDDSQSAPRPGVLVAHAWGGRSDFEDGKARGLAEQGLVGFALDIYGKGRRGGSTDENAALMAPFMEDRGLLRRRLERALEVMREQAEVDGGHCAGMGYCFGGLCMLDLARAGADVAGVISIHGLFNAPDLECGPYRAKILCLHGYDDPMAPPDSILALGSELSDGKADWQLHAYGGTMHAFTNPEANDPDFGTVYSPSADRRATQAIDNFLAELFSAG
jgi:dienelactone hydrolase